MHAQGKRTIKVGITVGLSLGAIVGLVGCGEQVDDSARVLAPRCAVVGQRAVGVNGLSASTGCRRQRAVGVNGRGQRAVRRQRAVGGQRAVGVNGLSAVNGLMTTSDGRGRSPTSSKCALAANDTLVKQDQNGDELHVRGLARPVHAVEERRHATTGLPEPGVGLHDGPREHRGRPRPDLDGLGVHRDRLGRRPRQLPAAGGDVLREHHPDGRPDGARDDRGHRPGRVLLRGQRLRATAWSPAASARGWPTRPT